MDKKFEILENMALFYGVDGNLEALLKCLDYKIRTYKKDDTVLFTGDEISDIGIVVKGNVRIIKEDINGNSNIINEICEGEVFLEAMVCAGIKESLFTIEATQNSEIIFINYKRITTVCSNACKFHSQIVLNLLGMLGKKNVLLNSKIAILSKRTMREKILAYFETVKKNKNINIPFNRAELADFLCVDRSALSRELSKMRNEGLIEFNKNSFKIN